MPAESVLVVEHEESCDVGWLGEWLVAAGATLDVRRCWTGDPLPGARDLDADPPGGLVVLGGSMGARDDDVAPWLPAVRSLVAAAAERDLPVLGLCLGHQLAALALGGEVARRPEGQLLGVVPLSWTAEAADDPLVGSVMGAGPCVHWNGDVVTALPPGGVLLATSEGGDVAVARLAPRVWGVQPHPEAGPDILATWADEDRDAARSRGVDVDHHVAQAAAARDELHDAWRPLGAAFAALCGVARHQGAR